MNLWRVLRAWRFWRRERQQRAAQDGRGVRIMGENQPALRKSPGGVEIVQNAADVGPTGPNETWSLAVGGEVYRANYLRPRHLEGYNGWLASGRKDAARFLRWFPDHPDRANERLRRAERFALRLLLVAAFPQRPSYAIRGNPVQRVFEQPLREQAITLVALLAHVREPLKPTLRDRLASRRLSRRHSSDQGSRNG